MDELTKRFDGFQAVMTTMLDKLSGLEEWRSTADATMAKLLSSTTNTAPPPHHSEQAPPSSSRPPLLPVRPTTAPPHLSAHNFNPFDLNLAPPQDMRPSASSSERPSGHHIDHSTTTGMLAVGFSDPIRHTRSRVCFLSRLLIVLITTLLVVHLLCPN